MRRITIRRSDGAPKDRATGWPVLRRFLRPHVKRVVGLSFVSFAGAMLEAGFLVLITGTALALANGEDSVGPVVGVTLGIPQALIVTAVLLVLRLSLGLAGVVASSSLTVNVSTSVRRRLAGAYLNAAWAVQQGEPSGRLQELVSSFVNQVNRAVGSLAAFVTAGLSLLALLAVAVAVDPIGTLAVIAALAVLGSILAPLRRRIRRSAAVEARSALAFSNSVAELGSLGMEMQAYGVSGPFTDRIDRLTRENARARYRVAVLAGALPQVYTSLAYAAFVGGIAVASVMEVSNLASIGAVMLLMLRSLSYGQQIQTSSAAIASSLPFLENIDQTIARYEASTARRNGIVPAHLTPIDATGVSFGYSPERPVLTDVSFRIEPHEIIGVVGPSGAGKSTLVQLLLGLREPTEGALRVHGIDLREVDRAYWHRRVAFVAQDALLFTGTVAENIRFFRDGIDDAALRRAARAANLLADVESLPDGFDTHLGERGSQLSGGQRQRLSIARALAGDPEVLILDEPTSALDVRSESLIRQTLVDLRGRVTVIVIAHRMSTLDMCDRIAVIEGGRLTAFDTPEGLRRDSDFYRNALALSGIS